MKDFFKKVSLATGANIFVLFVSVFSTLIFPKIMTVHDYSLWQLYVLYAGYVMLAELGIIEGIYLIYGGKKYEELDEERLSFATIAIFISSLFFMSIFFGFSSLLESSIDKKIVAFFTLLEGVVWNLRVYPILVLQATNRFKEFSIAIVIGRLAFFLISLIMIIFGLNDYYYFFVADILGCAFCAIYGFSKCKDKLLKFSKIRNFKSNFKSLKNYAKVGYKLLIATIISTAILGVIRLFIMNEWSIIEFGKISLTITCTNLFLKFATSIGQVLFPTLCNIEKSQIKKMFYLILDFINILFVIILLFYKPFEMIFLSYLPDYTISFVYMGYLLPICIFETQVALVHNTFYKVLRYEKELMYINLLVLLISIVMSFICTFFIKSLFTMVILILFILALRSILLEIVISKKEFKKISINFDSIAISLMFIITNRIIPGIYGIFIYFIFLILFIYKKRMFILNMIKKIKNI